MTIVLTRHVFVSQTSKDDEISISSFDVYVLGSFSVFVRWVGVYGKSSQELFKSESYVNKHRCTWQSPFLCFLESVHLSCSVCRDRVRSEFEGCSVVANGSKESTRQDRCSGSYREEQVLLRLNAVCQAWKFTVRLSYTV